VGAVIILGGARPAVGQPADDDGLRFESRSTYRLDTTADLVRVTVDVTVTNEVPNQGSTSYFFDYIHLTVPAEATEFVASESDGGPLTVTTSPSEEFWKRVEVELSPNLLFGQTQRVQLRYVLRVNDAFTSFLAWGYGDPGLVAVDVVVPAGLEVEIVGTEMSREENGNEIVFSASAIAEPERWTATVVARDESALADEQVDVAGHHIRIRGWPVDPAWTAFVTQELERGVPVLEELVGLPWPAGDDLEIIESVAPFAYGYAGWYDARSREIEVWEEFDPLVIFHELAHLWFNSELFSVRWINEGLADEFASQVMLELTASQPRPDAVAADDPAALDLNAWTQPAVADEQSAAQERYGYNTSWHVVRGIADEVGIAALADVIEATADRNIPYRGDEEPEDIAGPADWRRFLDLLEEVGGSETADGLFRDLVVGTNEIALLDRRATARADYDELEAAGDDWAPPLAVRSAMSQWDFEGAAADMEDATEVLALRDDIAGLVRPFDLDVPEDLETAYEGARNDLAEAEDLADDIVDAAEHLADAETAVASDRNLVERAGLLFTDVDARLDAAETAFEAGSPAAAVEQADAARALADGAASSGARRLAIAAGVTLLVLTVLIVAVRHGRRSASA
jgi:hypothetical protein